MKISSQQKLDIFKLYINKNNADITPLRIEFIYESTKHASFS